MSSIGLRPLRYFKQELICSPSTFFLFLFSSCFEGCDMNLSENYSQDERKQEGTRIEYQRGRMVRYDEGRKLKAWW